VKDDIDFEEQELARTRFDPAHDAKYNEYIDVPKGFGGIRLPQASVPEAKPLEIVRRLLASTAHMTLETNKELCRLLPNEGDSLCTQPDEVIEIIRKSDGFLVRKLCEGRIAQPQMESVYALLGNRRLWYALCAVGGHLGGIDEVLLDAHGPVYPQWESWVW